MLLRTPEQTAAPPVVSRAAALQLEWQALGTPDLAALLTDTRLLRMHEAMLPPPRRPRIDPIDVTLLVARTKLDEAEGLQPVLAALTTAELATALGDAAALRRLVTLASHDPRVSAAA
jgi:membrane glycosyltransferase